MFRDISMPTDTLKVLAVNYLNTYAFMYEHIPVILQLVLTTLSIIWMAMKIMGKTKDD